MQMKQGEQYTCKKCGCNVTVTVAPSCVVVRRCPKSASVPIWTVRPPTTFEEPL
jgi:hypothetical protein